MRPPKERLGLAGLTYVTPDADKERAAEYRGRQLGYADRQQAAARRRAAERYRGLVILKRCRGCGAEFDPDGSSSPRCVDCR